MVLGGKGEGALMGGEGVDRWVGVVSYILG